MTIRAILGEPCRYQVDSSSTPGEVHLVDLMETECSCKAWVCNHREHMRKTGRKLRCKHIVACRETFLDDVLEAMKANLLTR